jgi:aminocarboxymuconate-semialdehyde decarboxylase
LSGKKGLSKMSGPKAIDIHSHFWPRGLINAANNGREWYGWQPLRDANSRLCLSLGTRYVPLAVPERDLSDIEGRLQQRDDEMGIDLQAVSVGGQLYNYHLRGEQASSYCREINEELAESQALHPNKFRALGTLPIQETARAIDEVEYSVKELGIKGFAVGGCAGGMNLDDPWVVPIIETIASAGASLFVHPNYLEKVGDGRYPRHLFGTSLGTVADAGVAAASIIYSGIFDRYPDAHIAISHGGGMIQWGIGRLEIVYSLRDQRQTIEASPSEYLKKLFYDCLVHDDLSLQMLKERAGVTQILIGTDYPFSWDIEGGSTNWIKSRDYLTEADKLSILRDNALRFLKLSE